MAYIQQCLDSYVHSYLINFISNTPGKYVKYSIMYVASYVAIISHVAKYSIEYTISYHYILCTDNIVVITMVSSLSINHHL